MTNLKTTRRALASQSQVVAQPSSVEFTDYEVSFNGSFFSNLDIIQVGDVLECLIHIRNQGFQSRRIRVIPPSTPYFLLASVQYPAQSGMLAPGMYCTVAIHYHPVDRRPASDDFVVQVEGQ